MKKFTFCMLIAIIIFSTAVFAFAGNETRKLNVIARAEDCSNIQSIERLFQDGADMVSVNFEKLTADEAKSAVADLLDIIPLSKSVILDNCLDKKEEISEVVPLEKRSSIIFRGNFSPNKISKDDGFKYISIYGGGVIFSAINRIKSADESTYIQFQSKNYFNPFYQKTVTKLFDKFASLVIAPMYEKNLCGQRQDSIVGWDEMLQRNFNAIETNNPVDLKMFLIRIGAQQETLISMIEQIENEIEETELESKYTSVSVKNFKQAKLKAKKMAKTDVVPMSALQQAKSELIQSRLSLTPKGENDNAPDAWNITPGKIAASVLSAAGLIIFEIFIISKKRERRRKHG